MRGVSCVSTPPCSRPRSSRIYRGQHRAPMLLHGSRRPGVHYGPTSRRRQRVRQSFLDWAGGQQELCADGGSDWLDGREVLPRAVEQVER